MQVPLTPPLHIERVTELAAKLISSLQRNQRSVGVV